MENLSVSTARNLATWRSIVVIKISIKQTFSKNIIKSNLYMLIKNLIVEKEIGTWIVDVAIIWPKINPS